MFNATSMTQGTWVTLAMSDYAISHFLSGWGKRVQTFGLPLKWSSQKSLKSTNLVGDDSILGPVPLASSARGPYTAHQTVRPGEVPKCQEGRTPDEGWETKNPYELMGGEFSGSIRPKHEETPQLLVIRYTFRWDEISRLFCLYRCRSQATQ